MPSKSKKQAKLMRAVAHGWKPSRIKGPTRAVAKEFASADKRRDKVTGYRYGGYTNDMDEYAGGGMMGYEGGGPAEYQFGGGVPYRGVPPQRGMIGRGPTGMMGSQRPGGMMGPMGGRMGALRQMMQQRGRPGGGGYGRPGGVPGTIGGYGGYQGGGGGGRWGSPVGPGGPILSPYEQSESRMRGLPGGRMPSGPPGLHDPQDMLMGEGPGGRLEQEGMRRRAKMRGPGRFPGAGGPAGRMNRAQSRFGALTQGAPGGGSFGKPRPSVPGRRIAPPPGRYPGGGNPMTGGRNPLIRGAGRRGGRRGMRR